METSFEPKSAATRSATESPLRSAIATAAGDVPTARLVAAAKPPEPFPTKRERSFRPEVGGGRVELPVTTPVTDRDALRARPHGIALRRRRSPRRIVEEDRNLIREIVRGREVRRTVAVEVALGDRERTAADGDECRRAEAPDPSPKKIETLLTFVPGIARSSFPSPFKSAITIARCPPLTARWVAGRIPGSGPQQNRNVAHVLARDGQIRDPISIEVPRPHRARIVGGTVLTHRRKPTDPISEVHRYRAR